MTTPTHIQVTVLKAKDLIYKGKNGTNDAYLSITFGKEKFLTSTKEKSKEIIKWNESSEIQIPPGQKPDLVFTALHKQTIGDRFLGVVAIPVLVEFNQIGRNVWYPLKSKPGSDKQIYRGEIQVRIGFSFKQTGAGEDFLNHDDKGGFRSSIGSLLGKPKKTSSIATATTTLAAINRFKRKSGLNAKNDIQKPQQPLPSPPPLPPQPQQYNSHPPIINVKSECENERRGFGDEHTFITRKILRNTDPGVQSDEESISGEIFEKVYIKKSYESLNSSRNSNHSVSELDNSSINGNGGYSYSPSHSQCSGSGGGDNVNRLSPNPSPNTKRKFNLYNNIYCPPSPSNSISLREPIPRPRIIEQKSPSIGNLSNDSNNNVKTEEEATATGGQGQAQGIFGFFRNNYTNIPRKNSAPIAITSPIKQENQPQSQSRQSSNFKTDFLFSSKAAGEIRKMFENKTREELLDAIHSYHMNNEQQRQRINDLEDYMFNLLVRILETQPSILQKNENKQNTSRVSNLFSKLGF